jgi:branched-chain amino acid transport system permease protein
MAELLQSIIDAEFLQYLINGVTLGSIYGLIAIGYTMVFGIIGMVNFAHGDVFMLSAFIALIILIFLLTTVGISGVWLGIFLLALAAALVALYVYRRQNAGAAEATKPDAQNGLRIAIIGAMIAAIAYYVLDFGMGTGASSLFFILLVCLVGGMFFTSVVNWAIERVAYRPLRGSFRLAPLISAIGMSLVIVNLVQISQGADSRVPGIDLVTGSFTVMESTLANGVVFNTQLAYKQILIVVVTAVLLTVFWYLVQRTPLGRAQRACEQDRKMATLLGIDVDRTISITFIMGASLAAIAGVMWLVQYNAVIYSDGFIPGVKAFTAAVLGGIGSLPGAVLGGLLIGLIEAFWQGYVSSAYKDVASFSVLIIMLIFLPQGILGKPEVEKV